MKQEWPAWRFGPNGERCVFNTQAEVPEGWMTRLQWDVLEAAKAALQAPDSAPVDAEAEGRLKAVLMALPQPVLNAIEDAETLIEAATLAIPLLAAKYDLSGDGKVEDNRDEIKKALKAKGIEFDGRAGTPTLKALLDKATAQSATEEKDA